MPTAPSYFDGAAMLPAGLTNIPLCDTDTGAYSRDLAAAKLIELNQFAGKSFSIQVIGSWDVNWHCAGVDLEESGEAGHVDFDFTIVFNVADFRCQRVCATDFVDRNGFDDGIAVVSVTPANYTGTKHITAIAPDGTNSSSDVTVTVSPHLVPVDVIHNLRLCRLARQSRLYWELIFGINVVNGHVSGGAGAGVTVGVDVSRYPCVGPGVNPTDGDAGTLLDVPVSWIGCGAQYDTVCTGSPDVVGTNITTIDSVTLTEL